MVVLEGRAQIKNNQTNVIDTINAGESFIIPKGYDCQWIQEGYLRKFYVIAENSAVESSEPENAISNVIILPNDGDVESQVSYQNNSGNFTAGIYKGNVEESPIALSKHHRFIYIKQGSLTLIDHNLTEHHFKEGDAFIILNGAQLGWRSDQEILHHYVELVSK